MPVNHVLRILIAIAVAGWIGSASAVDLHSPISKTSHSAAVKKAATHARMKIAAAEWVPGCFPLVLGIGY